MSQEAALRPLGWARVIVGGIFLLRTTPAIHLLPGLLHNHGGPLFGWPSSPLRMGLYGIVLPTLLIKALVVVRTVAALFFMIGVRARLSGIVAAVAGYVVYSQEPLAFIFTLHVLYASTLLLAIGDGTSVVAFRPERPRSPASSLTLLRTFVASVYAWSAVSKLRGSWLSGRTLFLFHQDGVITGKLADIALSTQGRARAASIAVMVVELLLPPLLLLRRTRAVGIALACALHGVLEVTVHPDVFGWVMVTLLLSFWPVDERA